MRKSPSQIWLITALCGALASIALHSAGAANPDHVATFKKTLRCPGCDLSQASLMGIQAPNAQLQNADLSHADLYGGSLRNADLSGAILNGTNLEMVDLTGAIGAVLEPAKTDSRTTCPDGTGGPCS
ncbi:MAG: pentapeptide repeat-containing protein [Vicinamibacterales bacterium]